MEVPPTILKDIIPDFVHDSPLSDIWDFWFQNESALVRQPAGVQSFLKNCFGQEIIRYSGYGEEC